MPSRAFNLFTVPAGCDPLRLLARRVLAGFPFAERPDLALSCWRILLPSRRAAQQMKRAFAEEASASALLLPQIRPIADVDHVRSHGQRLPNAIPDTALQFSFARLAREWATENSHLEIARDLVASPRHALQLARTLVDLVAQMETEEISLEALAALYGANDYAGHREAVTGLLGYVRQGYEQLLQDRRCIGASQRRNLVIRHMAEEIAAGLVSGPIIAAGSTGTNPATRALLAAIAGRADGAVILPGLDRAMDDADWLALTPTHPQFGLKQMLVDWSVSRHDVLDLAPATPRAGLIREIMRPSPRTDQWVHAIAAASGELRRQFSGVSLIEADDRHREARAIALILRECVETPGRTAALVTPDRDLALRVTAELGRWDIAIADSAGRPVLHTGGASVFAKMLDCIMTDFAPASVIALLHSVALRFEGQAATLALCLELAARQYGLTAAPSGLVAAIAWARDHVVADSHLHPVLRRISADQWQKAADSATTVAEWFEQLVAKPQALLADHIEVLRQVFGQIHTIAESDRADEIVIDLALDRLARESGVLGMMTPADAAAIILQHLASEVVQPEKFFHSRLAIYGLAEARMMHADIMVLGGLVEGKWPAQPDAGPWLNRAMRDVIGLSSLDRDIGLTAHDFAEGLAFARVYVTWPRRIGRQPVVPSRWVLRLRTLLQGLGLEPLVQLDTTPVDLAQRIDAPARFEPFARPRPSPPVALRPRAFSVTEVEKLIRDPYHIYARRILRLEPLQQIALRPTAALHGTLLHAVLDEWNRNWPYASPAAARVILVEIGSRHFAPLMADPVVSGFWWPRFQRMATELCAAEAELGAPARRIFSELKGELGFMVAGVRFYLSARMDRLDLLPEGAARIIDYKSGQVPSGKEVEAGWLPQLTLQAHMVKMGAFATAGALAPVQALYVQIGGGRPAVSIIDALRKDGKRGSNMDSKKESKTQDKEVSAKDKVKEDSRSESLQEIAGRHFQQLQQKLASYLDPAAIYLPRPHMNRLEDVFDYDHLSRFREWQLALE